MNRYIIKKFPSFAKQSLEISWCNMIWPEEHHIMLLKCDINLWSCDITSHHQWSCCCDIEDRITLHLAAETWRCGHIMLLKYHFASCCWCCIEVVVLVISYHISVVVLWWDVMTSDDVLWSITSHREDDLWWSMTSSSLHIDIASRWTWHHILLLFNWNRITTTSLSCDDQHLVVSWSITCVGVGQLKSHHCAAVEMPSKGVVSWCIISRWSSDMCCYAYAKVLCLWYQLQCDVLC